MRPTTERVREALFSMIGQELSGQTVLDAFGGAGMVGLECWSRGAKVTIVERDRRALAGLRERGRQLGADWTVLGGDIFARASRLSIFDGVFLDPPYRMDPVAVVERLGHLARSWLVVECDRSKVAPRFAGELPLDRERDYGKSALWIYRHPEP